jgi:hypothetical protein
MTAGAPDGPLTAMSRHPRERTPGAPRIPQESARSRGRRTSGTWAAFWLQRMLVRSALAVASGTLLPACLTQNVQYEPPRNYPPSIETPDTARHPLNSVIQVPITVAGDGGTQTATVIELNLEVRDPNVDQRLEYRLFVDFDPMMPRIDVIQPIPAASPLAEDRLTRRVEIPVPITQLDSRRRCHRIEVLVSSAFEGGEVRTPIEPGDVATATWWVARQDADTPTVVDMRECR